MNILLINTSDARGGAARVCLNLQHEYQRLGHVTRLAVGSTNHRSSAVIRLGDLSRNTAYRYLAHRGRARESTGAADSPAARWLRRAIRWSRPFNAVRQRLGREDLRFPESATLIDRLPWSPDLIHCHNLHGGYFDLRALPALSAQFTVMLTLHDAWLLSGHCAHSFDCQRWQTGCGECPDLTIPPAAVRDATAHNWRWKREIIQHCSLHVATPSQWLFDKLSRSLLQPAIIEKRVIPNGVDLSVFHPTDSGEARRLLGLRTDDALVLFAANGVRENVWKDHRLLRSAIEMVSQRRLARRITFLTLGEAAPAETIGRAEVRFVTHQADPTVVARYFQAADIYIHAARVDTFPNTVLEALACGTPVVATAVGGIPEQVNSLSGAPGAEPTPPRTFDATAATGILTPPGAPRNMADAVEYLLDRNDLAKQLGTNAARDARRRFSLTTQAEAYLQWGHDIRQSRLHHPVEQPPP